jgi:predicted choloylglycine hydrolase
MSENGSVSPAPDGAAPERPPVPTDWREWLRWAARRDWTSLNWTDPNTWRRFVPGWAEVPAPPPLPGGPELTWRSFAETDPGAGFAAHWARVGPALERWWRSDGRDVSEDSVRESREQLRRHMPELEPAWESLVELAGGGAPAATVLALWNPPPFLTGCSQAVVPAGGPALLRNYDWDYRLFDATVAATGYLGRGVLGTEDCGWGLLDGVNDAGLAVSLTFGGRPQVGAGFGIPLVLRYVLQVCTDVEGAVEVLRRVPVHMSYNVTVTDPGGRVATVYVAPDRPATVTDAPAATNHQGVVEWLPYCEAIGSENRLRELHDALTEGEDVPAVTAALLRDPLYATRFEQGFGTLYTLVIRPVERSVSYHWPGRDPWTLELARPRSEEVVVALGGADQRTH